MGGEDKNATVPAEVPQVPQAQQVQEAQQVAMDVAADPVEDAAAVEPAAPAAPAAVQGGEAVTLSARTQFPKYTTGLVEQATGCVHMVAAESTDDGEDSDTRASLDLVAVIDVSGSMAGDKLALAKEALQFIVQNLKPTDSLCVVSYHSQVKTEFGLTKMDAAGKAHATQVINALRTQGCTNLSGGLFEGIRHLQQRQQTQGKVGSVMLMTDGMANEGIRNTTQLCDATRGLMGENPDFTVYTFGYGASHNVDMLQNLSEVGGGMYYFVETNDMIPESFAHCLGGLLTVKAQNMKLTLTPHDGVQITKVHTARPTQTVAHNAIQVDLSDMQAEEQRDVVFHFKLDKTVDDLSQAIATATLTYMDVEAAAFKETSCVFKVERTTADISEQQADSSIQAQLNRIETMEAMQRAMRHAESGDFLAARQSIDATSARLAQYADSYTTSMRSELAACSAVMAPSEYRSKGMHEMRSRAQAHQRQRANVTQAASGHDHYRTKAKSALFSKAKKK